MQAGCPEKRRWASQASLLPRNIEGLHTRKLQDQRNLKATEDIKAKEIPPFTSVAMYSVCFITFSAGKTKPA